MTTASFPDAIREFQTFLARLGYRAPIEWFFLPDLAPKGRTLRYSRHRSAAHRAELARQIFQSGLSRGVGVELSMIGAGEAMLVCTVFAPEDSDEAEALMISGVKMSVPKDPLKAEEVAGQIKWLTSKVASTRPTRTLAHVHNI